MILFPELAIPSYTCGDLFFQQHLYEGNLKGLSRIIEASASLDAVIIAGFYLRITNRLFDCAAVIRRGKLLGVIPKMFAEKGTESSESRWFAPGVRIASEIRSVRLFGEDIPFGRLLFSDDDNGITLRRGNRRRIGAPGISWRSAVSRRRSDHLSSLRQR